VGAGIEADLVNPAVGEGAQSARIEAEAADGRSVGVGGLLSVGPRRRVGQVDRRL
jgi:hypothetical protein